MLLYSGLDQGSSYYQTKQCILNGISLSTKKNNIQFALKVWYPQHKSHFITPLCPQRWVPFHDLLTTEVMELDLKGCHFFSQALSKLTLTREFLFQKKNGKSSLGRMKFEYTSRSLTARPWKMVVGRLLSYWEDNFQGRTVKLREGNILFLVGVAFCKRDLFKNLGWNFFWKKTTCWCLIFFVGPTLCWRNWKILKHIWIGFMKKTRLFHLSVDGFSLHSGTNKTQALDVQKSGAESKSKRTINIYQWYLTNIRDPQL